MQNFQNSVFRGVIKSHSAPLPGAQFVNLVEEEDDHKIGLFFFFLLLLSLIEEGAKNTFLDKEALDWGSWPKPR